jgi:hypothetical protein
MYYRINELCIELVIKTSHFVIFGIIFSNTFGRFSSSGFRNKFQEILRSCFESNYGHRSIPKGANGEQWLLIHNKCYVSRSRLSKASHATINVSCIMVAEPRDSTKLLMKHDSEPDLSNFHPDNPSTYELF